MFRDLCREEKIPAFNTCVEPCQTLRQIVCTDDIAITRSWRFLCFFSPRTTPHRKSDSIGSSTGWVNTLHRFLMLFCHLWPFSSCSRPHSFARNTLRPLKPDPHSCWTCTSAQLLPKKHIRPAPKTFHVKGSPLRYY